MAQAHDHHHHDHHHHDHAHHDHAHHDHGHHHGHGHVHAPASFGRAFAIGIALNTTFVVIETVYGLFAGSMALVADAGHNLSDVLGLGIAWSASVLAARPPSARFTYGLKSSSILAALANASLLLVALGAISLESMRRLLDPQPVATGPVMAVAAIGIVINTVTALMFMGGRHHDINVRGAFLHMAGDAAVSAGVVVAALVIGLTQAWWIDPVVSLAIVALIGWSTWGLARDALHMGLLAVPPGISEEKVRRFLGTQAGVSAVHDLHIWPMSTTETALTAHLVMPAGHPGDAFLHDLAQALDHDYGIGHATVQIEIDEHAHDCALVSEAVV
jgi:cobalt-zinc-cadmium efflux system protein